ncbi:cysteine hydrolase family protein [Allohahella sp. A8]|uniref:cysteine hydrolase family protein n=1 Tax=Allohahella sp. A8 TaxID=3141461 RepID=UPI000C0BB79E|nr:isochorismatase [Hahellaceae bacterium]|tara:strand:+ start:834 stop:1412 length:579 start_codon:yes stop_codon:yes gene_type:complete
MSESFPENSPTVLLIIDMMNDLEFEDGEAMLPGAVSAAKAIAKLKQDARQRGVPIVYVNDNFGKWRSNFAQIVDHCLHDGVRGKELVELLEPDEDDYFVIKSKHSGFYGTTLEILLRNMGARHLVLTGITADICVLFTAQDAYMRDYDIVVPRDCVACVEEDTKLFTLKHLERACKATIVDTDNMKWDFDSE